MGAKDIVTKDYTKESVVFADAFNQYIYKGEQVINPEKLRPLDTNLIGLPYGAEGAGVPVQKFRDVSLYCSARNHTQFTYFFQRFFHLLTPHTLSLKLHPTCSQHLISSHKKHSYPLSKIPVSKNIPYIISLLYPLISKIPHLTFFVNIYSNLSLLLAYYLAYYLTLAADYSPIFLSILLISENALIASSKFCCSSV